MKKVARCFSKGRRLYSRKGPCGLIVRVAADDALGRGFSCRNNKSRDGEKQI